MSWSLRDAAREPLVHFLVVGAVLAALEHFTAPTREEARVVVVDASVRADLVDAFEHEHGTAPTDAEQAALIDQWIDEEVLYREGLARGLDREDARVRQRVASMMSALVEAQHPVAEPTEEEVRAYFDAHVDRFAEDARFDFVHVFVRGEGAEERAATLLAQLEAGASPAGLGETFSGGRHYRGRRLEDLAASFGDAFIEGFDTQPVNVWALHRSRFGLHLVRIERRSAAANADFERARLDVEHALREEAQRARSRRAIAVLRERWEVVER